MKKIGLLALSVVAAGAFLFTATNIYANKDLTKVTSSNKTNHQKTLEALGIEVDASALKNLKSLKDKSGKNWTYNTFTQSHLIEEKMKEVLSEKAATSFIEVQDDIMANYSEPGDVVPVILLSEDMTEGSFTFLKDKGKGKVVTFKLKYDKKSETWSYK
ncbi:hypothetical protein [Brevibacillus choshinensis]|uniref:hypothetical protein n=1 Tax=Brevibacillus choshinensis TaxID=54911 RepID=UPI002E1CE74D|nr:hypothetical protein [Brevibacillus choshinensis]